MNHKIDHRKLGLPTDQRRALLTNLTRQFIRHGYIRTTLGRAKEVQRVAEHLITASKTDNLASRRKARKILVGHSSSNPMIKEMVGKTDFEKHQIRVRRSLLNGEDLVHHLFANIAPRFKERQGGYTRITKLVARRGDGAPAAVLELVE